MAPLIQGSIEAMPSQHVPHLCTKADLAMLP